jgi:hypothetical protein
MKAYRRFGVYTFKVVEKKSEGSMLLPDVGNKLPLNAMASYSKL